MIPPIRATAVIFTSMRSDSMPTDGDDSYAVTSERMKHLAQQQPGYLGMESARDAQSGFGITVSYWADDASARAWKQVAEHLDAQRRGLREWYASYSVIVAEVTRAYSSER